MSDDLLASRLRERGQRVAAGSASCSTACCASSAATRRPKRCSTRRPSASQLSLPTVYATLDLLGELGLVRRIAAHAGAVMYDPRPKHAHAVCRRCGSVTDIDGAVDTALRWPGARQGFAPDGMDVAVYGLCERCYSSRLTVAGENAGRQIAT